MIRTVKNPAVTIRGVVGGHVTSVDVPTPAIFLHTVKWTGSLSDRRLRDALAVARRQHPMLDISWRILRNTKSTGRVAIDGTPKFILPIKGSGL